jgi:DNA-binding transcriptional LysR family regulator
MDLNRISLFVRVVETESFTAAAASLGLPKSSVSRGVARLEEDLGVRLLQRTTRKLSLTDAGRAYFNGVREAMQGLDEATGIVKEMGTEPQGLIRLTAPPDLGATLAEILARFLRRYPKISFELSLVSRTVNLVEEGFDLAIRAGRLQDSSLVARKVGSSEVGLFASPSYLKRRGKPKVLADLAEHECVLYRSKGSKATWRLSGPAGDESVEVRGVVSADEMSFVRQAVVAGLGIGLVPAELVAATADRKGILATPPAGAVRLFSDYAMRGGAVYVVAPTSHYQPARVTLFRDFLIENLRFD